MKELYKIILSLRTDRCFAHERNIRYMGTISNRIKYDLNASKFQVPFRKNHNYAVYHCNNVHTSLHEMIYNNYYDDFKIILTHVEDHILPTIMCNAFEYACMNQQYRFIIHMLKTRICSFIQTFLVCDPYNMCDNMMYRVFRYIKSDPFYSKQCLLYSHHLLNIFKYACTRNRYKIVSFIIAIDPNVTNDFLSYIKNADECGHKDLVIILYDAWMHKHKEEKRVVNKIYEKYL